MKTILTTVLLAATGMAGYAQADDGLWSYDDCVEYARTHNISLQQAHLAGETARYSLEGAKGQWQPTLDFSTTQGYSNAPWGNGNKNSYTSNYGLNASWTVYNGGQRENDIKKSRLQVEMEDYSADNIFRNLQTDMLSVYINLLYARESITINEEAVKVSEAQAARALELMNSGRMSRVDYSQLEAQAEQDRYNLVSARSNYDTQRMSLKKLLELGIDRTVDVQGYDWSDSDVLAPVAPLDESYSLALATDAQLKYDALSIQSAELDIKSAQSGRYPTISLNAGVGAGYFAPTGGAGGFGTQMKQSFGESVGLTLSVPIFDQKKTKTAVAKARVQKLNADLDREQRENEIAQIVEGWYIDLKSAQARYVAGQENLKAAMLSDEQINERYQLGYVDVIELMQSHSTLLSARHELLQAKYMAMLGHKMIEFYRTSTVNMDK